VPPSTDQPPQTAGQRQPKRTSLDRFLSHVEVDGNCLRWTGAADSCGYGWFKADGTARAHAWAYRHFIGPVPKGHHVTHYLARLGRCIGPACVKATHLRAMTPRDSILASAGVGRRNSAKTHCPQGHKYTPENTKRNRMTGRACRRCHGDWNTDYARRKAAERKATRTTYRQPALLIDRINAMSLPRPAP